MIKAVGAASEQGADLDELIRIGEKVNSVTRTMGMALTSCTSLDMAGTASWRPARHSA